MCSSIMKAPAHVYDPTTARPTATSGPLIGTWWWHTFGPTSFDAVTLVLMAGNGSACTGEQIEQGNIRESHVGRQHRFDLVFWPHPVNNGQGGIKCNSRSPSKTI
jgi:hypothetical protein